MRNGTEQNPNAVFYTTADELSAYDSLPAPLKEVVREAPFDVSVMGIVRNSAVMTEIERLGAAAPGWLRTQLSKVYNDRILPQAQKVASS